MDNTIEIPTSMEKGFTIILHAGNAKNISLEAITMAENKEFDNAIEKLLEAEKEINMAHKVHKDMLDKLANGEMIRMDLILTHALDHLTAAEVICLIAKKFITLYQSL